MFLEKELFVNCTLKMNERKAPLKLPNALFLKNIDQDFPSEKQNVQRVPILQEQSDQNSSS